MKTLSTVTHTVGRNKSRMIGKIIVGQHSAAQPPFGATAAAEQTSPADRAGRSGTI
jgi:hypothetical protein